MIKSIKIQTFLTEESSSGLGKWKLVASVKRILKLLLGEQICNTTIDHDFNERCFSLIYLFTFEKKTFNFEDNSVLCK